MPITYQLPLILNSATEAGATDKTSDGSSFSITLDRPILVPKEAKYCYVEVQSAEVWNTVPNIVTGVNDQILLNDTVFFVPQGLYDIDSLNAELGDDVTLLANNATQKIQMTSSGSNPTIKFNGQSFNELLGFAESEEIVSGGSKIGEFTAQFNTTDYFLIHCDLVSKGLRLNSSYRQIVAQILIDVPPGHQIVSTPQNVPKIPSPELIGDKRNTISVWLTNDKNQRVNTSGENFSCRLVINYIM